MWVADRNRGVIEGFEKVFIGARVGWELLSLTVAKSSSLPSSTGASRLPSGRLRPRPQGGRNGAHVVPFSPHPKAGRTGR